MQRPNSGGAVSRPATAGSVAVDSLLAASVAQMPPAVADSVKNINSRIAAMHDSSGMAVLFAQISAIGGRNKQPILLAYYNARAAKLENSEKKLTFAGQLFLQVMENENDPSMHAWEAGEAISCLERSQKINPDNEDTKLALATGYIEGSGEPMKGVQILLAVVREKPEDVPANLLLGKMSVQSGQLDKAIGRFETVLKKEPDNKEALYFLAQAWEGKGDKAKAIEYLEKCKKIVNDPAFSRDIDQKINSLK